MVDTARVWHPLPAPASADAGHGEQSCMWPLMDLRRICWITGDTDIYGEEVLSTAPQTAAYASLQVHEVSHRPTQALTLGMEMRIFVRYTTVKDKENRPRILTTLGPPASLRRNVSSHHKAFLRVTTQMRNVGVGSPPHGNYPLKKMTQVAGLCGTRESCWFSVMGNLFCNHSSTRTVGIADHSAAVRGAKVASFHLRTERMRPERVQTSQPRVWGIKWNSGLLDCKPRSPMLSWKIFQEQEAETKAALEIKAKEISLASLGEHGRAWLRAP
ncbi:uncharacterized protein LOC123390832 [Mustela putorius furo]|uniref:Uncharacterized protein LOC123390832 n=1 Tax=Mustela putorius furo TaxID=9669 RepID=A0A8U0UZ22_MUSPF|nr:uncharacterized protein LOC123390832 [Mustela putorius furo]